MARKTASVTITAEGRDHGKVFLLTEMPASQAERWATRALLALGRSGTPIDDDVKNSGMAGIAVYGLRAFAAVGFEDIDPLLTEMMDCVQFVPDASKPTVVRDLIEDDIQEVATRVFLRSEVVALHLGFSIREPLSNFGSMVKNHLQESSNTPIPPVPSEPSSAPDSPV